MEGEPDAWTTVEKKLPKKKGRDVSKEKTGDRSQASGSAGDRRKKDSVTSRADRGRPYDHREDRRQNDNRDRRHDRGGGGQNHGDRGGGGRRPPSGRGGSGQRNTLPRRPRDGETGGPQGQGGRVPNRPGVGQQSQSLSGGGERKQSSGNPWESLATTSNTSSTTNSPRKQSWASLVDRGPSASKETTPTPPVSSWATVTTPSSTANVEKTDDKEFTVAKNVEAGEIKDNIDSKLVELDDAKSEIPKTETTEQDSDTKKYNDIVIPTEVAAKLSLEPELDSIDDKVNDQDSDVPKIEEPETTKCDTKVANPQISNEKLTEETTESSTSVSTNQTNITTQNATNEITSDVTNETAAVKQLSSSNEDSKLDNKTNDSLDNEIDGLSLKIDKDIKDESVDANGNSVSLDSNKNKMTKGMTPDMEDILSRIGPDTRHYDRDILLMLQQHPLSLQKPDKLPELEIVLDAPLRSSSSAPLLGDKPVGANISVANSFGRPGGMPTKRDSRRKEPKKVISISREPVKLRRSENAYKPKQENNDSEMEALSKKVRAILNKLTPQKFQTLVVQFKEIEINTEERLRLAIELIFEKAVEEPAYSTAYASMCKELSLKRVTKAGTEDIVDFRSLLLEQCRNEFQRDYISKADKDKFTENMNNAATEDDKKKIKAEFESMESKMRKRSLGNMRFIGELYLQQLTRQQIIHEHIISRLLENIEEESLECLCRFLTTCGAKLEADQLNIPENIRAKFSFDKYFIKIGTIIGEKKTSSRVRFMLQDLVELRVNKWVNKRRKEAGPKTIDDIHKEAKLEELKTQLADSQHSTPVARRSEEKMRRKTEFRPKPLSSDEGWNNVPTKAAKVSLDMDPDKLRSIRKVDADSLRLGGGFSSWGLGSSTAKAAVESKGPTNRFQLLEEMEQAQAPPVPATGEGSHLYAGRASEPVIRSYDRSSSRASASLDKPRSQDRDTPVDNSRRVLRGSDGADTEALRSNFKLLLREYISNCDFKETLNSICELFSHSTVEILVEETINQGLEEIYLKNRSACGTLLSHLVKEEILSPDAIWQGMSLTLESAEDILIDIPRFWEFLADILVIIVVEHSCFNTLVQSCASYLPDPSTRKKFLSTILTATNRTRPDQLSSYVTNHKTSLEEFVSQDIVKFLEEHNIVVDENPASAEDKVKETGLDEDGKKLVNGNFQESLSHELGNLFEKCNTGNKEIEAVDKILRDNPLENETIRTLVYAVMESVIGDDGSGLCSIKKELLSSRIPILKKYIDADKERELYAMFALQSLVHKLHHPNKLLHNMIEQLYDGEVISDDGIFDWENNMDVDEQEGKGVAVAGCKQFLEWLRTADEASDPESS